MSNAPTTVDTILERIGELRRERRHLSLADIGDQAVLTANRDQLANSPAAGDIALALAESWDSVFVQRRAVEFLQAAFENGLTACIPEVAHAIQMLPAHDAQRLVPALLDALDEPFRDVARSVAAADVLTALAAAGVVGWSTVTAVLLARGTDERSPHWGEALARSAEAITVHHPAAMGDAIHALERLANNPEAAADALTALGSIQFAQACNATRTTAISEHLSLAEQFFARAVESDPDHDQAIFRLHLARILLTLFDPAGRADASDHDVTQLGEVTGRLIRFEMDDDRLTLPNIAKAQWATAAVAARQAIAATSEDPDRIASYDVLVAVADAYRAATALEVGGEVVIAPITDALARDEARLAAARRIIASDPDDPLASELTQIIDRFDVTRGKAPGRPEGPADATIESLLADVATRCRDQGREALAAIISSVAADSLLTSRAFDRQLAKLMDAITTNGLADEDLSQTQLATYLVLAYARRKTDATTRFGGFTTLAGKQREDPAEQDLQNDFAQTMSLQPGIRWTDEHLNLSAGRVDGLLHVAGYEIPVEFKAEDEDASPDALERYVKQADRYSGSGAPVSFLVVLDLTPTSSRYNDITDQSWAISLPPGTQHGRTRHVILAVIPGNMAPPHASSAKRRKRRPQSTPRRKLEPKEDPTQ